MNYKRPSDKLTFNITTYREYHDQLLKSDLIEDTEQIENNYYI